MKKRTRTGHSLQPKLGSRDLYVHEPGARDLHAIKKKKGSGGYGVNLSGPLRRPSAPKKKMGRSIKKGMPEHGIYTREEGWRRDLGIESCGALSAGHENPKKNGQDHFF